MTAATFKKRDDLIGQTGSITRNFEIIGAREYEGGSVEIRIRDNMGNEYWTSMEDELISLD
ncbi:hypothetical protein [Paenibacillus agilis]|uniref:Uncharacterized protein n=1 Tax=Paenibacillus agilis TaxID=3020863 RepID=A0A559IZF9_9BACL|nr:hypothetical protein [Paenibacillus agilis]TVX93011.1 hypothetical protein FPZ44_08040 [Paenibacillus agilis]